MCGVLRKRARRQASRGGAPLRSRPATARDSRPGPERPLALGSVTGRLAPKAAWPDGALARGAHGRRTATGAATPDRPVCRPRGAHGRRTATGGTCSASALVRCKVRRQTVTGARLTRSRRQRSLAARQHGGAAAWRCGSMAEQLPRDETSRLPGPTRLPSPWGGLLCRPGPTRPDSARPGPNRGAALLGWPVMIGPKYHTSPAHGGAGGIFDPHEFLLYTNFSNGAPPPDPNTNTRMAIDGERDQTGTVTRRGP